MTLNVYEGVVDIAIPVTANAEFLNWNRRDKPESLDIDLIVRYQVCGESVCYPPKTENLSIRVPLGPLLAP